MKLRIVPFLFLGLFLTGCDSGPDTRQEEVQIREVFEHFWSAIKVKNGEEVSKCISVSTFRLYEQIRQMALRADREELNAAPPAIFATVLVVRASFTKTEIEAMSERDLVIYGTENEWWVVHKLFEKFRFLGDLVVDGNTAYATAHRTLDEPAFYFSKEEGEWKVNLARTNGVADQWISDQASQAGRSLEGFVLGVLAQRFGSIVSPELLDGPRTTEREVQHATVV